MIHVSLNDGRRFVVNAHGCILADAPTLGAAVAGTSTEADARVEAVLRSAGYCVSAQRFRWAGRPRWPRHLELSE